VKHSNIVFLAILLLANYLDAETWVRGALTLHEVSGQVVLREIGEGVVSLEEVQMPVSTSGLVNCEALKGASAFFSTSNRNYIYFEGNGSFGLERFEQIMPDPQVWADEAREPTQSRMILNFRSGILIVDSRNMLDLSQCLIETPVGRLMVRGALWQMQISFDPRSQIFDFTINCSDGRVRFTDLGGQQYTLRAGQRLAGAGVRETPSIEVGEKTDRFEEQMEQFQILSDLHFAAANEWAQYSDHLKAIKQGSRQASVAPVTNPAGSIRRPIVIEYASEPDPVTPFRAEVKPPTVDQADIF
jgi:hypothetical protein